MPKRSVFEIFLRTGRRVADPPETKFNPWHDSDDGRFTFANQGRHFSRGAPQSGNGTRRAASSRVAARSKPQPGPSQNSAIYVGNFNEALARTRREMGNSAMTQPAWRSGGRMPPQEVKLRAANAMRMFRIHTALGMAPEEAAAWAANAEAESRSDYRARQPGGPGRGLFQWGAKEARQDRRRAFKRLFGHSIEQSTEAEQLAFRDWELANTESSAARKIAKSSGAGGMAAAIANYYERPAEPKRDAADRANLAEEILRLSKRKK